jgi:hypothetical protein
MCGPDNKSLRAIKKPNYNSLRKNPRFQKLVAGAK